MRKVPREKMTVIFKKIGEKEKKGGERERSQRRKRRKLAQEQKLLCGM